MSRAYHSIAFTPSVVDSQIRYGSRAAMERVDHTDDKANPAPDPLTDAERAFVAQQDGFYLATTSESGWPYVQFRGGPTGFVTTPDSHTLAWADLRGNRQYISVGNLAHDSKVAMIFLDYARQVRLKVFGLAKVSDVGAARYAGELVVPTHRAIVEREVRVEVQGFDWNCPQHITPRYTAAELETTLAPMRTRMRELETENQELTRRLAARSSSDEERAPASQRRKENP
jgi:uncharacterized protein